MIEPPVHPQIEVISTSTCDCHGEPVTTGIPLPKGWCRDAASLAVLDADGVRQPAQMTALHRWIDGSVRWLLVDFFASCRAGSSARYNIVPTAADRILQRPAHGHRERRALTVAPEDGAFIVDTGGARFVVGPSSLGASNIGLVVTAQDGGTHQVTMSSVEVEVAGSLRATIRMNGECELGRNQSMVVEARLTFWAGLPAVSAAITLRNPSAAGHPGGYWELGSHGALYIKDASILVGLPFQGQKPVVECSVEPGKALERAELPFEVYQDSTSRGYLLKRGPVQEHGLRAEPIVRASGDHGEVAVAVPRFWQNFPRAIEASREHIRVRLFPRQAGLHELQGGEQKTHVLTFAVGPDPVTALPLEWVRRPLLARASPEWYACSRAVPYLIPESSDRNRDYVTLVRSAIDGPESFVAKREVIDEYGWRNFGDLYADHEAVGHPGPAPLVSHYNNQYDAIAGFAIHFMRSGDPRWWELLRDLAPHVVDIDIYHTAQDKSAYNGGLFWHTAHYVDAGTSTHRSYPRLPGVPGGGPGNEHNYSTGLMLAHFLTGEARYRDAVIGLAQWVLNMDDGGKTIFRWLDGGATGLASMTSSTDYHGPGRGAAYSIDTLLNAHRLTDEAVYFRNAEQLIRRCVHPDDDVESRDLLNAERRWHYTVFLQTLGRYLDYKLERDEIDGMYGYAKTALLHYARWMATHEYPYLDKPDALEYPNETWPAQDMRKSEVFMHAARHSAGHERATFEERADFFFRYSTTTLSAMETRGLTRPVVLMLTNGYMREWFVQRTAEEPLPSVGRTDFGKPSTFVPQKSRVLSVLSVGRVLLCRPGSEAGPKNRTRPTYWKRLLGPRAGGLA